MKDDPYEKITDLFEAIYNHSDYPDDCINTLLILAHLMVDDSGGRLNGAEYKRTFEHGRLKLNVHFRKADYKNERT